MTDIVITNTEGVTSTIQNLPAWATEATQKNMQTLLKGLGTSSQKIEAILRLQLKGYKETTKKTADGNKEIQKLLKVLDSNDKKEQKEDKAANKAMENAIKELNNLTEDSLTQLGKLGRNTNDQSDNLNKILKDLNNSGDGIMSFANLGGVAMGGFAKAVTGLQKLMGALGLAVLGALKYIGSSFIDTFKILNNSLSAGTGGILGLTTNIENVARSANLAGMSLDEFATFAQANSKILRILGAENFANLYSTTLLTTNGLLAMGMTADDSVESIMTELEYRRRFGLVLNQNSRELQTSLLRSARELRIFANAVGMSEADLRNESQIREDHTDLMQSQVKAMGGNTMELANNAQSISRALSAVGGQSLIDPIFESISKGATGLSSDFITLGQNMPQLITMIEKEAARFDRGAGTLNADLGFDLIHLLRNTTLQQRTQLNAMASYGIEGAADLQNMIRKAQALSEEAIVSMRKELDPKTMSVLNVFNRLGFVANQVTATLGDFGKTFALEFLGFGRTLDENGNATYDFTKGVESMTKNIRKFATNVFGYNSPITDSFDSLATYIDDLFLPQGAKDKDESDADYQARLDDAREKFVDTISKFAIDLARDLKEQIKQGTLFNSIKDFFKTFFDDLMLAINQATGGVLFDNATHKMMIQRYLGGEIDSQQFTKYVGSRDGEEREFLKDALINDVLDKKAKELGITNKTSRAAGSGKYDYTGAEIMDNARKGFNQGEDNAIFRELLETTPGFDLLDVAEQRKVFDQRFLEIYEFNRDAYQYQLQMLEMLNDAGIDTTLNKNPNKAYWGYESYTGLANRARIDTRITDKNMAKFNRVRENYEGEDPFDVTPNFVMTKPFGPQEIMSSLTNKTLAKLGYDSEYNKMSDPAMAGLSSSVDVSKFKTAYKDAMADKEMDYKETKQLIATLNELSNKIGTDDTDSRLLVAEIEKLIKAQDDLTNELRADNAS